MKERGIEEFAGQQRKRIQLLERMLADFDDGRSKSFYCKAAASLDLATLEHSLDKAIQKAEAGDINPSDAKTKANTLKGILSSAHPVNWR